MDNNQLQKMYDNIVTSELFEDDVKAVSEFILNLRSSRLVVKYVIAVAFLLGKRYGIHQERQRKKPSQCSCINKAGNQQ